MTQPFALTIPSNKLIDITWLKEQIKKQSSRYCEWTASVDAEKYHSVGIYDTLADAVAFVDLEYMDTKYNPGFDLTLTPSGDLRLTLNSDVIHRHYIFHGLTEAECKSFISAIHIGTMQANIPMSVVTRASDN